MLVISGALTVLLVVILMQTFFRLMHGTLICTKYFGDEVVITRR
jgi:hypothetical protein